MAFLLNEEDDFFPVILGQHDIAVQTTTAHFKDYGLLSTIRQEIINLQSIADEKSQEPHSTYLQKKCKPTFVTLFLSTLTKHDSAQQLSSKEILF